MSTTPESPSPDNEPLRLPARTTPTWEIELLLSGALVFSLFALREPLESALLRWLPTSGNGMRPLIIYGYLYGKMVLYTLLLTFSLHLAARARWVALVGVHSVYPHGPRWENVSAGPISVKVARRQCGDGVEPAIERADNLSSLVFAFGILAAQMLMAIGLISIFVALLGIGLAALGVDDVRASAGLVIVLVTPLLLASALDKWLVRRLPDGHWIARLVERLMSVMSAMIFSRMMQPLLSLLTTNLGGKRGPYLLIGAIYLVMAVVGVDSLHRLQGLTLFRGEIPELQRDGDVAPSHYASLRRGDNRYSVTPFIQSEVVEGPYLKLVVPYVPQRHDTALSTHCPAQHEADDTLDASARHAARRAAEQARMDCLGALLGLQLDGNAPRAVDFERYRDPASNGDALLAMIDIRDLAPGRHVLSVRREPKPETPAGDAGNGQAGDAQADGTAVDEAGDDPRAPVIDYQIVFWR